MKNSSCVNCLNYKNSTDHCSCNDEIRCCDCENCAWCISHDKDYGRCVPLNQYNSKNCRNYNNNIQNDKLFCKKHGGLNPKFLPPKPIPTPPKPFLPDFGKKGYTNNYIVEYQTIYPYKNLYIFVYLIFIIFVILYITAIYYKIN